MSEENRKERDQFQGAVKKVALIEETVKEVANTSGTESPATAPSTAPRDIVEKYVKRAKPISTDEPATPAPKKKS